ncbi:MAG TPA: ATP-binding protein [Thermoanaerobaculia bacterium]|nr:ATP-binding protein [Thermoanaerobaculia bacterium]
MDLRDRLLRHRKDTRLIVGGLALLLFVLAAAFYLLQRGRDLPAVLVANRLLLFVLWYANVVLILIVLFVLLRNLFKLAVERRHRVLGSKFKTKLVASYIGLSLIPVLLLFLLAAELLQGSIDRWFNAPARPVLEQGSAVAQALYRRVEEDSLRAAGRVLAEVAELDLESPAERTALARRLRALAAEHGVDLLAVYEGTEFVQAVVDPRAGLPDLPEPGRDLLEEAVREGRALRRQAPPGGRGRLLLAAAAEPGERLELTTVVVAGDVLEPALAGRAEALMQGEQSFRQLEVQKDDLRASHFLIFLMMTLLILLASSWVGLYLARRVTVPILALAEGTRRISGGELSHRVDVEADDELGVLVSSFNRMTAELEASRALLERRTEELLEARQLAAWNEAARRLAHEIKNPLTPIRLAAERVLRKQRAADPGLGAAIEEGVEVIVREVGAMQAMVDEFSRYARMPRPRPVRVDLGKLVDETLHLYRGVKPGVAVEGAVAPELGEVWLDPEQIKRALINLLDNAVEATPPPGRVELRAAAADGHLEIRVADTGPGIPPEAKEKLFLPYYSTKGRGTGLGLSIVHRIVTDHQGTIRVEDNRPQGAVFTIELPLQA